MKVYVKKKNPVIYRKPKAKRYVIVKSTPAKAPIQPKEPDFSSDLSFSQCVDHIILAFRKRHGVGA